MSKNKKIQNKLNELVNLFLTKGAKPSEIIDNIFLNNYTKFNLCKENNIITMEIFYIEEHNDVFLPVVLEYLYDEQQNILEINEIIDGFKTRIWSREDRSRDLIFEINNLLREIDSKKATEFLDSLPIELKSSVCKLLDESA
ncbi:hypothetical protein AB6819_06200 [Carnobacterium maltaromaticum]|uniref:hypothetical protein n=1 Tax=Carnobacterium maltaromaticum TaxID=2751 RepID=UPI001C4DE0D8|nr:hypothetical protein [Carnobacterium maltaromaticum]